MPMTPGGATQHDAFEKEYTQSGPGRWAFHDSKDPLTRYLRDRRLSASVQLLERRVGPGIFDWRTLVVCGGVGGEGTYLANRGFRDVTVSDFSDGALLTCRERDSRLRTRQMDAERLDARDGEYDLLLVQDGLHHLRQPTVGLTEMLRVARRAVVVIEPHAGLIARTFGRVWEEHDAAVNYVFRWRRWMLEDVTRSYLLKGNYTIDVLRLWDKNTVMGRIGRRIGGGAGLATVKAAYAVLNTAARPLGNMFIGVVIKAPTG